MRLRKGGATAFSPFFASDAGTQIAGDGRLARFFASRRVLFIVAAIVLAFSIPIAAVVATSAASLRAASLEQAARSQSLGLLARTHLLERRLRELRAHLVASHRITSSDRSGVERSLFRLQDAADAGPSRPAIARRLRIVSTDWTRIPDRGRPLRAVDATIAAATDLYGTVTQYASLASDNESQNDALETLVDGLPTIDDRIDQERNIAAGALASRRLPVSATFAIDILHGQEAHAYQTTIVAAERLRLATGDGRLLNATRRLGFDTSRFDAAVRYGLTRRGFVRASLDRVSRRGDDVARDIDDALSSAGATAADGYARRLAERTATFERTRNFAFLTWIVAVVLTAASTFLLYRRERAARTKLLGDVEESLALTRAQLEAIFEHSPYGVAVLDDSGATVRSNAALRQFFGDDDFARTLAADARFGELFAGTRRAYSFESRRTHGENTRYLACELSAVRLPGARTILALLFATDATDRRDAEAKLRYETSHDPISRLPNRINFLDRVARTTRDEPSETRAVTFVELGVEQSDASFGYTSDELAAAVAARLASCVEPNDFVARFDGNTFAVLHYGSHDRASAREAVEKIFIRLAPALTIGERDVHLTANAGTALTDRPYGSALEILQDAETAMVDARSRGNAVAVFVPDMRDRATRKLALVTQLRRALERDQMYLVYQPLVDSATETVRGFEALLRWEHPELGNIPPFEFIPLAEDVGTIGAIGRFVLDRAVAQLGSWHAAGIVQSGSCKMSINVSVRELVAPDYAAYVMRALARHAVSPSDIVLEVTESAVLFGDGAAAAALARLKAIGVDLAIDDFGTGYSSLRYLHDFPFQELKIDGSFVRGADGDLAARPIVTMLVTLAKTLGISTVAEGVETQQQAAALRELGVDLLQGYVFSRPLAAALVPDYMRGRRRLRAIS